LILAAWFENRVRAANLHDVALTLIPEDIRTLYECHEWKHACAILNSDFTKARWSRLAAALR
jgi:hypothetical protein